MQLDTTPNYYAFAKLNESARAITQHITELPLLRKRFDKYANDKVKAREIYNDLQNQRNKLCDTFETAALSLLEMELPELADYAVKLSQSVKAFNLMTLDYGKLCSALSGYLSKLPVTDESEGNTTSAAVLGRMMNNVKMGYYPTESAHINMLRHGIEFPEGVSVNLFDPCCGCGLALRALAQDKSCQTYGIELDRYRAEESLTRLNRVGFGSYFHSRVSREAFHFMLLNPPYLHVLQEGGGNTRSEKRFLVDSLSHLMHGGLLAYIIPYYRLTSDICRILSDNLGDISVWKFVGSEFDRFRQVAIFGTRRKRQENSDTAASLAAMAIAPDTIPALTELPENRYTLPAIDKKVDLFKGAEFNVAELAEQLNRSTSFSRLFEKNKLDSSEKRPLLPLNLGQVGLIGGSGLINGLVECETPHVIKGRIVKENTTRAEENLNSKGEVTSTTLFETRSNKMIFNILTPNGFKSLS